MEKMRRFFDGKGFYIALSLCAVAVITVTYVTVRESVGVKEEMPPRNEISQGTEDSNDTKTSNPVENIPAPDTTKEPVTPNPELTQPSTPTDTKPKTQAETTPKTTQPAETDSKETGTEKKSYIKPADGEVLVEYSQAEPVFSKAMNDWRIHQAVDIAGSEGSKVKAVAAGTVEDTYFDEMMGYTVVLDHGDGVKSVYQNLQEKLPVEKGDQVKSGDVIGGIGRSAAAEFLDDPHVHFEIIQDGERVNPYQFIESH